MKIPEKPNQESEKKIARGLALCIFIVTLLVTILSAATDRLQQNQPTTPTGLSTSK